MKPLFLLLIFFISAYTTYGCICESQSDGDWENSGTWLCCGVEALPSCGDTIYIKTGHTVTVTTNNSTLNGCGLASFIIVENGATLDFGNGDKLALDCGSGITVEAGGTISASGAGGGASNNITICGAVVWQKSDGDITAPGVLGSPLPVELLHFSVAQMESQIEITWSTMTEIDNEYFIVERSSDFIEWDEIARQEGQINSSIQVNYVVYDELNQSGTYYYRLKQYDLDGASELFDAKALNYNALSSIEAYPNPSNGAINLGNLNFDNDYLCQVIDCQGRVIKTVQLNSGNSLLDLSDRNKGHYILRLSDNHAIVSKQIIIE